MREIERDIYTAIKYKSNAGCANTMVTHNETGTKGSVYLHGNLVAQINYKSRTVKLNNRGYETNTTKSRLNVVLQAIGSPYKVRQRNHQWELFSNTNLKPFKEGMVLSF